VTQAFPIRLVDVERAGLVPRPLISRDFILTEMVCPIQIEIMKKVR